MAHLGNELTSFCHFLRLHPSTAFWTLAIPFLLRHSCPQEWSSELNSPIPIHISSLISKMFRAISCLTNLPWFKDLTFQVPMPYCSMLNWTLLLPPGTSITEHCFHFGSASSFFLELFLYSSPIAYCTPVNLRGFIFRYHIFLSFILFMGFSTQGYWSGLPFPSLVDHALSELSTMTRPSWVTLHGRVHNFVLRLCPMGLPSSSQTEKNNHLPIASSHQQTLHAHINTHTHAHTHLYAHS